MTAKERKYRYDRNYYRQSSYAENHRQPWTKEEEEMVLAHTMTDKELSYILQRSIMAIQYKRCALRKNG